MLFPPTRKLNWTGELAKHGETHNPEPGHDKMNKWLLREVTLWRVRYEENFVELCLVVISSSGLIDSFWFTHILQGYCIARVVTL